MTANQGVGMGEGKKVAQEGAEGQERWVEEYRQWMAGRRQYPPQDMFPAYQGLARQTEARERSEGIQEARKVMRRLEDDPDGGERYRRYLDAVQESFDQTPLSPEAQEERAYWAPFYAPCPDRLRDWSIRDAFRQSPKERAVREGRAPASVLDEPPQEGFGEAGSLPDFLRLAERWLPEPGAKWIWQPDNPEHRIEVEIEKVIWNGEEFWVTTVDSARGVQRTAYNDLERFLEAATPCTPPAPPATAPAAGETSSGGERRTAGGAYCCEELRRFLACPAVDWNCDGTFDLYLSGDEEWETFQPFQTCPWCGEKLGGEG